MDNRQISGQKSIAHVCYESIPLIKTVRVVRTAIVKKQAADAPCFITMMIPKIGIAFLFVVGVKVRIVFVTNGFTNLVKVGCIFFKKIIGREV